MNVKQIIVIRKDLNMRKGKMVAQGAHASLKVVLDLATTVHGFFQNLLVKLLTVLIGSELLIIPLNNIHLKMWLVGLFTKICVSVDSEDELMEIYNKANELGLNCSLIQDAGKTEFDGIPTYTCCAIGPDDPVEINKVTGHLKLL